MPESRERDLEVVVSLTLGSLLIFFLTRRIGFVIVAVMLLFVSLISKSATAKIVKIWLRITKAVGGGVNAIVLTVIFYGFLTPLAWLYRRFHKNPLFIEKGNRASFFINRNHVFEKEDFEKPW